MSDNKTEISMLIAERDELKAALEAQSPIVASYIAEQSGEGKPISALGEWLRLIAKERHRAEASEAEATDLRRKLEEANAEIERMTPKFVAYEYLESPAGREIAEARITVLEEVLAEARDHINRYADTAAEHDLIARIDALTSGGEHG